jgi:hypothetical protein
LLTDFICEKFFHKFKIPRYDRFHCFSFLKKLINDGDKIPDSHPHRRAAISSAPIKWFEQLQSQRRSLRSPCTNSFIRRRDYPTKQTAHATDVYPCTVPALRYATSYLTSLFLNFAQPI